MVNRLYLDHAATTPMRPEAIAAVVQGMERWANPSSPHAQGRAARAALEDARRGIAAALGWGGAVILTGGASEAIAIALMRIRGGRRLVSAVEHDAVLRIVPDPGRVPVSPGGMINQQALASMVHAAGAQPLVAIQHVNSETGVIQPIDEIAAAVRGAGGVLFVDCAQSAGRLPLPEADLIAISAHKLGGPPGIGALLVQDLALIEPSGGQEFGYRGGTENVPAALGFAAALAAAGPCVDDMPDWVRALQPVRARLDAAVEQAGGCVICGTARRSPLIASYRMPAIAAAAQLIRLDMAGIAVSAGSACSSGTLKQSHVLAALGMAEDEAAEVIRVSFGWTTTDDDVARFIDAWTAIANGARQAA